ncbi:MAG: type II secretion system F family protein [Roseibacillus sp.]|jgi:type II secretory pathway component PulF|tara:strand:+ start:772 stop:1905 length:1134 start_codon:yes stop_codon:yes gene_type:complete
MSNGSATTTPVSLSHASAQHAAASRKKVKIQRFKKKDLIHLFRGLASMLKAQINTSDALKYYGHGLPNKAMASTLEQIRFDTESGMSIHEAFRRTGRFDDMTIGLIQAGGDSGQLNRAFRELADRLKADLYFRKQIRKAVLLPGIVIAVLIGAFIVSQVKIVPQVEGMLEQVRQKPDGLTAIAFKVSHATRVLWPFVVLGVMVMGALIWRSEGVRNTITSIAMSKWRLLSQLIMSLRQMTFLSTMELLYSNGINLSKSMRVAANSVKTTPLYPEIRHAADQYEHSGVPLSLAFSKFTSVDEQVVHMMSIGERSASIDNQLKMLADMYEEEAENYMNDFTQVLNFIVLLMAVSLIAAVFIGTFLPIFLMGPKMMQSGI